MVEGVREGEGKDRFGAESAHGPEGRSGLKQGDWGETF